jgi:hypothetical protein
MIVLNCYRAVTNDALARGGEVNEIASATKAAMGKKILDWCSQVRRWAGKILRASGRPARRLRVSETVALGERRFVAVVEFEQARFLVGGTSASLVLLARLNNTNENLINPAPESAGEAFVAAEQNINRRETARAPQ